VWIGTERAALDMSEQRPGEHEAIRPKGVDQEETEGHGVRWGRVTDDETPGQQDITRSGRATDEDDTEGHRRYSRASEGADER
jgi:hypothetical protein